jgi:DNA-binding response OmpR family regulator
MTAGDGMNGFFVRFGNAQFDTAPGRLFVAGRRVELDRPCAAILALLLREADQDVDKDRLLEAGWPGRVVHENSLAKAIGRLRQALGDDAGAIETAHGFGYRFVSRIEHAPIVSEPVAPGRPARVSAVVLSIIAPVAVGALWLTMHSGATATLDPPPLIKGEPADSIGRVLWVDDHPQNNTAERRYLESRKVAVYEVTTTDEALELLSMYDYGAVISDMNRGGKPLAGLALVKEMRRRKDETPFVLYTVVPSTAQRALLREAGGQTAAVKPNQLYAAVLPLFTRRHAPQPG